MRKIGVLCLFLFLLSGCADASGEIERGMMLRSSLLQGNGCSFDAEITADYGDKVHVFQVSCLGGANGDLSFTVTEPQTISGITGTIEEKRGVLTFDGMAVYFDPLTEDQISPVIAPWIFLRTLRSGQITSACMEENYLRLSMDETYEEESLHLDIWIDRNQSPAQVDILYDGRRIVSLKISNFAIL